jgi:class 3 adenylate cyclase
VDTQGDSFFVAFGRAQDAARAAATAQRTLAAHAWADGERVHVRMGVHTTEATATATGYVGMGVHRAARIAASAHGGQVVVSQAARDVLEDDSGFEFADLGEHVLKDFPQPQRLYQLLVPELPKEFPPLRTLVKPRATCRRNRPGSSDARRSSRRSAGSRAVSRCA